MIRKTIERTIAATFVVRVPVASLRGFACPSGTGFFVSPQGYFITAYHVVEGATDPSAIELSHEAAPGFGWFGRRPELVAVWKDFDLALLKFDFSGHANQEYFKGKTGFDSLPVTFEQQYEGTPIYSFGYPLPEFEQRSDGARRHGPGLDMSTCDISNDFIAL